VIMILGGMLLAGVLQIMQLIIVESLQQRVFLKSALELAIRIPRLATAGLRRHYVPELVNRFFDTVTVQKGLAKLLLDFSASSLQIVFGLVLLSFYHPLFIAFGAGLVVTLIVIMRVTGPMGLRTSLQESQWKYDVAHWLEEMGRNREVFKGMVPGKFALQRTDGLTLDYLGARKKHFRVLLSKYWVLLLFKILIIAGLLVIGSLLVVDNQLNLGQFVAVEIVTILVIGSVEKLVLSVETIYDVLTGLEKIGYITDLPLEKDSHGEEAMAPSSSEIRFKDFVLQFPDEIASVLEVKEMEVKAGARIRIEGGNPQTWHWFTRAISGDFYGYEGELSVGGLPVRSWHLGELRKRVGIFNGTRNLVDATLLENLTLYCGEISMDRVMEVVRAMGLNDFLQRDPEALNRSVGPEGVWLPYAVRARVLLCQLLLAQPDILLLADFEHAVLPACRDRFYQFIAERRPETALVVMAESNGGPPNVKDIYQFVGKVILPKPNA
ncbi:MAG: ABC transporter ATP-binding protein, partial [Bacteroidota bacterium]